MARQVAGSEFQGQEPKSSEPQRRVSPSAVVCVQQTA